MGKETDNAPNQGCTNPGRQIVVAPEFYTVAPDI